MRDAHSVHNFEQSLTQTLTIVSIAESREAQKFTFELPLCRNGFLDPVPRNCKISICVTSLPSVAGQINVSADSRALNGMKICQ